MKGRRRKPERLVSIEGGRSHHKPKPDLAPRAQLDPPASLPANALAAWVELCGQITETGIKLAASDAAALADLARCKAALEECQALVERDGMIIDGTKGLRKHPALQLAREYRANLWKGLEQFGCTPVSRPKVTIEDAGKDLSLSEKIRTGAV